MVLAVPPGLDPNPQLLGELSGIFCEVKILYQARTKGQEKSKKKLPCSGTARDLPDASFAGRQETFPNIKGEDPFSRIDLQRTAEKRLFVVILILLALVVGLVTLTSIFKVVFLLGPAVAALGVVARLGKAYIAIFKQ